RPDAPGRHPGAAAGGRRDPRGGVRDPCAGAVPGARPGLPGGGRRRAGDLPPGGRPAAGARRVRGAPGAGPLAPAPGPGRPALHGERGARAGMMAGGLAVPGEWLWPTSVILAALLGSFLNVCISRLPRGESVVLPASRCPHCHVPIRPIDNLPIVSFLALRGRCRACRGRISPRYLVVEVLAVGLAVLVLWALGPTWTALRSFVLALALLAVTVTDAETHRIPDRITLPGIVAGLVLAPEGLSRGSAGALAGALLFGAIASRSRDAGAAPAARVDPDPEDEVVDPVERRRLDTLWAATWGALLGREVGLVAPALMAS